NHESGVELAFQINKLIEPASRSACGAGLIEVVHVVARASCCAVRISAVIDDVDDSIRQSFHLCPGIVVSILNNSWGCNVGARRGRDGIANVAPSAQVPLAKMPCCVAAVLKCSSHRG